MNCSLLVLSMMIIINFPPVLPGEWGPESCSLAEPPPWAAKNPTVITYHRQSRGPRLNADENEKRSFWFVLFLVCGCVCMWLCASSPLSYVFIPFCLHPLYGRKHRLLSDFTRCQVWHKFFFVKPPNRTAFFQQTPTICYLLSRWSSPSTGEENCNI